MSCFPPRVSFFVLQCLPCVSMFPQSVMSLLSPLSLPRTLSSAFPLLLCYVPLFPVCRVSMFGVSGFASRVA